MPEEPEYGRELGPNNWTGAIGSLAREETDILAGVLPAQGSFADLLHFSTAVMLSPFSVLSGPPSKLSQQHGSVLSSLGLNVCVCLLIVWLCLSIFYTLMPEVENGSFRFPSRKQFRSQFIGFLLVFYGLLFQRGFDRLPVITSRRLVVTGWLIAVLVFMTVFGATLSSKLAVSDVPERIDRITDILKYPSIKPFVARNLISHLFIDYNPRKEIRTLKAQVYKHDAVVNPEKFFSQWMMDEISSGGAVAMDSTDFFLKGMVSVDCRRQLRPYHIAPEAFTSLPFTYFYRKGLPPQLVEKIQRTAANFGGAGLSRFLHEESERNSAACLDKNTFKTGIKPLTIQDLYKVFELLLIGLIISSVAFALEMAILCFSDITANRHK